MTEKKLGPSDCAAEVERLKAAGKLPTLEEVLDVVADARLKLAEKISKVRQNSDACESSRTSIRDERE